jgi:hypothetical protein
VLCTLYCLAGTTQCSIFSAQKYGSQRASGMLLAAIPVICRVTDVLPPHWDPVYRVQNSKTASSGKVFCNLWFNEAVS